MSEIISAIICTHNRAEFLYKAISSLVNQSIPKSLYEILVVDNCSTDSTAKVVHSFSSGQKVKYLYEPRLGLSHARNTGWHNAKGKYVAYLDDDAIADEVWLEKAIETFEKTEPMPGCIGGKITGIWESSRPKWLSDQLVTALTVLNWSNETIQIHDLNQKWLAGANIAFPLEVLKQLDGFIPYLDRVGNNLLSGGDVFLQKQIVNEGYNCFYIPEMAVQHLVPKNRLTQKWFISRYFWQGVSDAIAQIIEKEASWSERFQLALRLMIKHFRNPKKFYLLISHNEDPKYFTNKCLNIIFLGQILGLLYLARLEK